MQKTCGVNTQRWMQTLEAMPRLQSALQELESEGLRLGAKAIAAKAVDSSGVPPGVCAGAPCLPADVSGSLLTAAVTDTCWACRMMLVLALSVWGAASSLACLWAGRCGLVPVLDPALPPLVPYSLGYPPA